MKLAMTILFPSSFLFDAIHKIRMGNGITTFMILQCHLNTSSQDFTRYLIHKSINLF